MRRLQGIAGTPPQHRIAAPLRQRLQQSGLADAGFAAHEHRVPACGGHLAQPRAQHVQLGVPLDQLHRMPSLATGAAAALSNA